MSGSILGALSRLLSRQQVPQNLSGSMHGKLPVGKGSLRRTPRVMAALRGTGSSSRGNGVSVSSSCAAAKHAKQMASSTMVRRAFILTWIVRHTLRCFRFRSARLSCLGPQNPLRYAAVGQTISIGSPRHRDR